MILFGITLVLFISLNLGHVTCFADFFQVFDGISRCSDGRLTYVCVNNNGNYLTWDFKTEGLTLYSIGLNFRDTVGTKHNFAYGNISIVVEVAAINTTYLSSTATIIGTTAELYQTECNGFEINVENNFELALPTRARLVPASTFCSNDVQCNFTTMWSSLPSQAVNFTLNVCCSSILLEQTIQEATELPNILTLRNQSLYVLNIISCSERSTFTIGRCPFLWHSPTHSVVYYDISVNGSMTALVNCSIHNFSYSTQCGSDGEWSTNIADICSNTSSILEKVFSTSTMRAFWTTSEVMQSCAPFAVVPLASVAVGALIVGFVIGSVLSCLFCLFIVKHRSSKLGGTSVLHTSVPVYEEVEIQNVNTVVVSKNVAYGKVI